MGKKLVSRTAKVLSETKKSRDKEAVAIAYEHIPRNPEEQAHGSLYAVIEIEDSSGSAEELTERIIDVFHTEYYEDLSRDSLASFESSLSKINEELAERSGEGQINWLGKLNAVLGVLAGNTLHLTQAGKAETYLYRGEHSINVTDGLAGDAVNPLRTFINVASGDLSENDRVAFVTPAVFYKISKSELRKFVTDFSPKIAVENLSRVLSGENGSTAPNAVLLMEMISPESFAAEPEPMVTTEAWVKEEKAGLEPIASQTVQGTAKTLDLLGRAVSGASTFIATKAFPALKTGASKIKSFRKEPRAERVIIDSEERLAGDLELDERTSDHVLEAETESTSREIRIQEADHKPKLLFLGKMNTGLKRGAKKFGGLKMPRGRFSLVYLGIAAVLVVSLVGFMIYQGATRKTRVAAETTYNQAKEKYDAAISEISLNQRSNALEDLNAAENMAKDAVKTYKKADAEKLLAQIEAAKDQARGVTKNTAAMFADFAKGNLVDFFWDGVAFYGLAADGSVYKLDPKSKMIGTVEEKPTIDGTIKFATLVTKRKTIVAYTSTKNVYEIDLVSKKVTKQLVDGGWEDAVAIASFNTNVYLLSPTSNQIYKHMKTTSAYSKKANYLTASNGQISLGRSMAIDSDVYVLTDGEVLKFTSGAAQTYSLEGMPEKIDGLVGIYVDPNVKGQYLFDGGRVIKIDANGNFVAQYISDPVKNITGISVDDKTNTIFALSDGKVYTINYK